MESFRLVVRDSEGKTFSQGTGWFVNKNSKNFVVTALHVVGRDTLREWFHCAPNKKGSTYILLCPTHEVALVPCCFDASADIAFLSCRDPVTDIEPLRLADGVGPGQEWFTDVFPGFGKGKEWRLSGEVVRVRGDYLQLSVDQGTDVDWEGISGGAVCVDSRVVGVITSVTTGALTAWGANYKAVERLFMVVEVAENAGKLLGKELSWKSDLAQLQNELGSYIGQDPRVVEILGQLKELTKPEVPWQLPAETREVLKNYFGLGLVKDGLKQITPDPLNPDPWWDEFSPLFEKDYRAERFGGRSEELSRLDQFVDRSESGYFFVTGGMGAGKTALLATWVRSLKRRGERIVFHFITKFPLKYAPNGLDERFCFRSLCGQIAAAYGLGGQLPKDTDDLHHLYHRLLSINPPPGERVIVVLDGLDEAASVWEPGKGMFPRQLPNGIYVVFSAIKRADKDWIADIGLSLPANQVCTLVSLESEAIKEAVRRSQILPETSNSFDKTLDRVVAITQGNPSYLAYVLKILEKHNGNPDCLDDMPRSLSEALDNWWTEVFEAQGGGQAFEDLMGILALLREPFRREELTDVSYADKLRQANINSLIEKCVDVLAGDKERGYRLADNSVLDLVYDKLSDRMDDFRKYIAEFCMRWSDPKLTRRSKAYALHYGVDHLIEFNRLEDALGLITPEWFSTRWKTDGSYAGVIDDLDRLVRHIIDHKLIMREEPLEFFGMELILHLPSLVVARETARELMATLPKSLLRAMVCLGDETQALGLLAALSDWRGGAAEHLIMVSKEILAQHVEITREKKRWLSIQAEQALKLMQGKVDAEDLAKIKKLIEEAIAGNHQSAEELQRDALKLDPNLNPDLLISLASEIISRIETSKEDSCKVAFELLSRALGMLHGVRSTMRKWQLFDAIVQIVLQQTSQSGALAAKLVEQSIGFAESCREPELRAASLGRVAELAISHEMTDEGRRLLQLARQSLEKVSEPGDRLVAWATCIPALRALETGGGQDTVCGLFAELERMSVGDSTLVVVPWDFFVERWDPVSHGEGVWAVPLLKSIGEAQLELNYRLLSGAVLGALCNLGHLDSALDLLDRMWKAQPVSAARSLFSFIDIISKKDRALAVARLAEAKALLSDLREEDPDCFRAELAEALAVIGAWEEVVPLLISVSPQKRKNAVISCLHVFVDAELDVSTARETVDGLMKAATDLRPDEQAEVEGVAAWALAPFDMDYARSCFLRGLHNSLSRLSQGSLDRPRHLHAMALAEQGHFLEAGDAVKDCEEPRHRIAALADILKVIPADDHEALRHIADHVVDTIKQVDCRTLAGALSAACQTVPLLARGLPVAADRIHEQVERRLVEIQQDSFDFVKVCVAQISAFAATDSIKAVDKLRNLLQWVGKVGLDKVNADTWQEVCGLFRPKAVISHPAEFLDQAELLLAKLANTANADRVIYGAPYAAVLIEVDRKKALDLFEQYVDIVANLTPEYPQVARGFFVMYAEYTGIPLANIRPWEFTVKALASVAGFAPEIFERLISKTISSLLANKLVNRDFAMAMKKLLGAASKVPLSVQEQLSRIIHGTLDELSGMIEAELMDTVIDKTVTSLVSAGHKDTASTIIKYATGTETKKHVQWTLDNCVSRYELVDKTALEEFYLQYEQENDACMARLLLIWVHEGKENLAAYSLLMLLVNREIQAPRYKLLNDYIPLLILPCLKLWGLDAVETLVNNIADIDKYFVKAAELIRTDI